MGQLDWGLQIWTLLTFAGLLLLLARFAFKPFRASMQQREDAIRQSAEKVEQARSAAEKLLAENDRRLNEAREEARRVIGEGHRIVADMKRDGEGRARLEADELVRKARAEIERETQRSLDELKITVANLAVRVSRQVLKEGLDEARHRQLAEDFIERLKESHARHES